MSGLYSPINRAAELITRPKGTGAEYMAELQKKPGYKPAEAEDRDLQALMALPQMERAAFMEKLKAQANKFPLKMRELGEGQTHHDTYTLPGGENYREILLHTPMPEGQGFEGRSHHFGGMPNILASIRVKDRMTPEGKKMLHLEEIQSDWHQQGRESGYHPKDLDKQLKEVAQWKKRLEKTQFLGMDKYEYAEHMKALEDAEEEQNKLEQLKEEGVPYGPHAKDWHELALKAMIQHAAENGYDQIGITPGAEQAKRFSLSKQVGSVSYDPINRHFQAFKPNRETITSEKGATPERIQALIGKEAAAKLLQAPQTMGHHYLEGENLDIGGEGMKGFYDRMVPSFLNKFGKKHGVQVQQGAIGTGEHRVVNDGHADLPHRVSGPEGFVSRHATPEEAQARAAQLNQAPIHTFDITPAMREDILKNGIPRYDEGGIIHKAEGGSMQEPSIHQMRSALMGRPNVTSLSNLTSIGANEAPSMPVKTFIQPHGNPDNGQIPVGGVDENVMQPGQQLMPQQPQQPQQPAHPPQAGAQPQQGQPQPPQGPQSNILSLTPQGQAMAAMRPAGMADGGGVEGYSGGNRVKPQFAIAPSTPVAKNPENFTPYDHSNPTMKGLATAFDEAISHHLSLSPEEKAQNSIRAAERVADIVGRTGNGTPKDLLGKNEKLLKSEAGYDGGKPVELPDGRGIETTGLALAPAYREGKFDTCPNHHSCKKECLGKTSGNYFKLGGGQDLEEFLGPRLNSLKKTHAFMHAPHDFAVKLHDEITDAKAIAAQNGNHLGVRLNVLSDINPRVHKAIINAHPDVTFYDYTKNNTDPIASNHHYTYSSTGVSQPGVHNEHQNWKSMRRRLDQGDNVAMAFSDKHHLPEELHDQETGKRYKIINGDTHDFRPLDLQPEGQDGVIVGLKNKKATGTTQNAHAESNGFFVHYDPQLQMAQNAKGKPVYARSKAGSKSMYDTIPQNRKVSIQPQTRSPIQLTNDDGEGV